MSDPVILEQLQEKHRELAAEQARELGLLDENGEGSFTHPSLERLLYADGKVVAPLYKPKPGDVRVDKDSINRVLDDTMWLGRAHSLGHNRQLVNLLGFALMTNGLHRKRVARNLESSSPPGIAA